MGTLHGDQYTFFNVSSSFLLRMRNVSNKSYRENQITHFVFSNPPAPAPKNRTAYEIMWKNTVQPNSTQMTKWSTRTACWITKATNIHSQYVILTAYPPIQWLHERVITSSDTCSTVPVLRHTPSGS